MFAPDGLQPAWLSIDLVTVTEINTIFLSLRELDNSAGVNADNIQVRIGDNKANPFDINNEVCWTYNSSPSTWISCPSMKGRYIFVTLGDGIANSYFNLIELMAYTEKKIQPNQFKSVNVLYATLSTGSDQYKMMSQANSLQDASEASCSVINNDPTVQLHL